MGNLKRWADLSGNKNRRRGKKRRAPRLGVSLERLEARQLLAAHVLDDVSPSFESVGTWIPSSSNTYGDTALIASGNDGSNAASWTFADLNPGTYQIAGHWSEASDRASNAKFELLKGESLHQIQYVDQRAEPQHDVSMDRVGFQYIGQQITVAGESLTVRLNNDNADGLVVADAVVLQQIDPSPTVVDGSAVARFGGSASLGVTGSRVWKFDDAFIPVDRTSSYAISATLSSGNGQGGNYDPLSTHLAGIRYYDVDHQQIRGENFFRSGGSVDTFFTQDINPGDTKVFLDSTVGWHNGTNLGYSTLAWYGYSDGTGYLHPDYTYTRNVLLSAWAAGGIDPATNSITLRTPWAGPHVAAGTAVRNTRTTGADEMLLLNNQKLTEVPTAFNATVSGVRTTPTDWSAFRPGTAYLRTLFAANWTGSTSNRLNISDVTASDVGRDNEVGNVGIIGHWAFDESEGTVANDLSGAGSNGSLLAGANFADDHYRGNTLKLEGNHARLIVNPAIDLSETWTIGGWYKNRANSGSWNTLTRGSSADHQIIVSTSGLLGSYLHGNGGFRSSGFDMNSLGSGWHHVAAVGLSGSTIFYVDGSEVGSIAYQSTSDVYSIGNYQSGGQRFADRIDDVKVYSRSLNSSEVKELVENSSAGYWALENDSGEPGVANAGNGSVETLHGGASFTNDLYRGTSLALGGADARINVSPAIDLSETWTIGAWYKELADAPAWNTLTRGSSTDHQIIVSPSGFLGSYLNGNGGFLSSGFDMSTLGSGWHHVAAVGQGGSTSFYVDGNEVGSIASQSTSNVFGIGNHYGGGQQFSELIDDVRIYDRSLSASEIRELVDESPVGHWAFNETSGAIAATEVGPTADGTLVSGAEFASDPTRGRVLALEGSSSRVVINPPLELNAAWTIGGWYKDLANSGSWNTLTRGSSADHQVIVSTSGLLGSYLHGNGGFRSSGFSMNSLGSGWHHVAAVGLNGFTTFYVDGSEVGSIAYQSTSDVYSIGNYQSGGQRFADRIDDVRVYARSLTAAEVHQLGNPSSVAYSKTNEVGDIVSQFYQLIDDDADSSAFSVNGTWTIPPDSINNYDLDHRVASAGDGSSWATWTFDDVDAGNYQLSARWQGAVGHATNAIYEIFDGNELIRTVSLDQSVPPQGHTFVDNTPFTKFDHLTDMFSAASGQITVRLTNDANGSVVADALLLSKIDSPPPVEAKDEIASIFSAVHDNVELEFYPGLKKGPQATSETKSGNPWDQAALLSENLIAAGFESTIVSGRISVPISDVMDWVGVRHAEAAIQVLGTAFDSGPFSNGSTITFSHAWVRVGVPSESGIEQVDLDPSWKFKARQPGIDVEIQSDRGTFDEFAFLADPDDQLPVEFYEDQVMDFLAERGLGESLADVSYDGPIVPKVFDNSPLGSDSHLANATAVNVEGTFGEIVSSDAVTHTHRVSVSIGSWSHEIVVPESSLSSFIVRRDQENFTFFVDGNSVHTASMPSESTDKLVLTHSKPGQSTSSGTSFEFGLDHGESGRFYTVSLDANQFSLQHLDRQRAEINQAAADGVSTADIDEVLDFINARYWYSYNVYGRQVSDLNHVISIAPSVNSGLVTADNALLEGDFSYLQVPIIPRSSGVDFPNAQGGNVNIDATTASEVFNEEVFQLSGYTSSALEHAVLEEVVHNESISTIRGLKDAYAGDPVLAGSASNSVWVVESVEENGQRVVYLRGEIGERATEGEGLSLPYTANRTSHRIDSAQELMDHFNGHRSLYGRQARQSVGDLGGGVLGKEEPATSTPSQFMMYSEESILTRFTENLPTPPASFSEPGDHLLIVRLNGSWQYTDNQEWHDFEPQFGDRILASLKVVYDYSNPNITYYTREINSLEGQSLDPEYWPNGDYFGIAYGYESGDLAFQENRYETPPVVAGFLYRVTGTYFDIPIDNNENTNPHIAGLWDQLSDNSLSGTSTALVPQELSYVGNSQSNWGGTVFLSARTFSDGSIGHSYSIASMRDGLVSNGGYGSNFVQPQNFNISSAATNFTNFAGDPVNVLNGNMFRDEVDIAMPNAGVSLDFARHYDSQSDYNVGQGKSLFHTGRFRLKTDCRGNS